jgi:hypothetical protein
MSSSRTRSEEEFAFTAGAPEVDVFPLFGANKERVWAPGWDPGFVHPDPAADERGMVFTVKRNGHEEVWVNTEFDPENGRIQYASVVPGAMVTVVTIRLLAQNDETRVEVKYERTALSVAGAEHVRNLAAKDALAGPEWENGINAYLKNELTRDRAFLINSHQAGCATRAI